jgi:hypothetical protein
MFVEIFALLSRSSALLWDFSFAGMRVIYQLDICSACVETFAAPYLIRPTWDRELPFQTGTKQDTVTSLPNIPHQSGKGVGGIARCETRSADLLSQNLAKRPTSQSVRHDACIPQTRSPRSPVSHLKCVRMCQCTIWSAQLIC